MLNGVAHDIHQYIVAADQVHHLYVSDYAKAYPEAKVIGVEGLPEKRTDVKWDGSESRRAPCLKGRDADSEGEAYGKDPEGTKYGYEEEVSRKNMRELLLRYLTGRYTD